MSAQESDTRSDPFNLKVLLLKEGDVEERSSVSSEVDILLGDSSKAEFELGWKPKISFDELIEEMVNCEN